MNAHGLGWTWPLSVLIAAPQQPAPTAQPELPARRAIAGMGGFQSVSSLHYAEAPQIEHELTCTYVFPARARWQLSVPAQPQLGRHVEFRCGERYFELPQSAERSREVQPRGAAGSDWGAKCEMLELRLAVFLWPDGFEWRGDGPERRARGECGRELVAALDAQHLPSQMCFAREAEPVVDALRITAWRELHGRRWPATLEFWHGEQLVWKEQVDSVTTQVSLLDTYFLPPDRRASQGVAQAASVLHFDAPAQTEVREALASGTDWTQALDRWVALAARVDTQLPEGWVRLPSAAFELDGDGKAAALVVRLHGRGAPPSFAALTPARQALTTSTAWPPTSVAEALSRLKNATPSDARTVRRLLTLRGDPTSASTADVAVLVERDR